MRFLLIISLMLVVSASYAQSSRKNKKSSASKDGKPSSLEPYYPRDDHEPSRKSSKKKDAHHGPSYDSQQEYYDRMARLSKTREKNERLAEKPQYSDPMYFGHKRPPKKHKPGKMKFCKVCGIRH